MPRPRVIPLLLLRNEGLVKTVRFSAPRYLGDPINIVKLFNEKGADELILLDIQTTPSGGQPNFDLIERIAGECFMPLSYGGGVRSIADMKRLFALGIEKVALNTCAFENPSLLTQAAEEFGSQSIIASIDVRRTLLGRYEVVTRCGKKRTGLAPLDFALRVQSHGAGEILLTSIDQDGTMKGYDLALIKAVAGNLRVPMIASGGAGSVDDLASAIRAGATAAAAGSLFVFHGPHRAVLISYAEPAQFEHALGVL